MNLILLIVLNLMLDLSERQEAFIFYQSESKECAHCKLDITRKTESRIGTLKGKEIEKFLCSMDEVCKSNVEYSEYSNDVLFKILEQQTAEFVQTFDNLPAGNRLYILFNISHPIKDYDIQSISKKLNALVVPNDAKESLLKAIAESEEH